MNGTGLRWMPLCISATTSALLAASAGSQASASQIHKLKPGESVSAVARKFHVSIRAIARLERTAGHRYDPLAAIRTLPTQSGTRAAYFGPDAGWLETPTTNRAGLLDGELAGPLLVDEADSTCVVPPGCVVRLDEHGNIEVDTDG